MVINLQFFGGRGASSGISEKGNAYGTQYKTLLEYENIKFVTIATRSGFASEQSFYRNFHKFTGKKPLEWVKEQHLE